MWWTVDCLQEVLFWKFFVLLLCSCVWLPVWLVLLLTEAEWRDACFSDGGVWTQHRPVWIIDCDQCCRFIFCHLTNDVLFQLFKLCTFTNNNPTGSPSVWQSWSDISFNFTTCLLLVCYSSLKELGIMKSSINKTTCLLFQYVSLQELVQITPSWRHRSHPFWWLFQLAQIVFRTSESRSASQSQKSNRSKMPWGCIH